MNALSKRSGIFPMLPISIFCARVAAVVRRLASGVTTAATPKPESFNGADRSPTESPASRLLHFGRTVFILLAGLSFGLPARAADPELHVRGGLPNVAARAAAGGELRVAYFGGSITAADGWRPLATTYFRELLPKLSVVEISAGLPGTGSDLGACRLNYDVLRHQPDLIFVEFAVNDATARPAQIVRTMEGIVLQVRRANPHTDLCFIYTVSTPGLPDLEAGRFQAAARSMETVAAHYNIPSVHFGVEVARRMKTHKLLFKAPAAPDDPRTFTVDGVHPTPSGHQIYFEVLKRSLPALLAVQPARETAPPKPLHTDNWSGASLRLIDETMRHGNWTPVPSDDANLHGATKALLPPTWRTAEPGAAVEFEFTGTKLGLLGIASPDNGQFRVTVDDLPPVTGTFFDAFVNPAFCRQRNWFYPGDLHPGPHRVRVELLGTVPDKARIKAAGKRPIDDFQPYALCRLTLSGILIIGPAAP